MQPQNMTKFYEKLGYQLQKSVTEGFVPVLYLKVALIKLLTRFLL